MTDEELRQEILKEMEDIAPETLEEVELSPSVKKDIVETFTSRVSVER